MFSYGFPGSKLAVGRYITIHEVSGTRGRGLGWRRRVRRRGCCDPRALFERSELQRQILETKWFFFGSEIRGKPGTGWSVRV